MQKTGAKIFKLDIKIGGHGCQVFNISGNAVNLPGVRVDIFLKGFKLDRIVLNFLLKVNKSHHLFCESFDSTVVRTTFLTWRFSWRWWGLLAGHYRIF